MSKFFVIAVVLGIIFAIQTEAKAEEDKPESTTSEVCTSEDCENENITTVPTNVEPDVISDIDKLISDFSDDYTDKNTIAEDTNKLLQTLETLKGTKMEGFANLLTRILKKFLSNLQSPNFSRMAKIVIKALTIFRNAYQISQNGIQPNFHYKF